jgi:uncharacterized protein
MERSYCAFNKTRESFLGLNIELVKTPFVLLRRMFRIFLRSEEGLWLVPARIFHTAGLPHPVDAVYLDSELRVVDSIEHMRPYRIARLRLNSASILLLPAYSVYNSQTRTSDQLLICAPAEIERYLQSVASNTGRLGGRRQGCVSTRD